MIAGIAIATSAIMLAIVLIAVGEEGRPLEITGVADTNQLVGGMAQAGSELGSPEAPVTISIFNDLQCPECADYQDTFIKTLIDDYVRPGEARLDFRNFSIGRENPTTLSAVAATAAGEQDREWQFVQLLYANLGKATSDVNDEFLRAIAGGAGVDVVIWDDALEDTEVIAIVEADAELARQLKLTEEPAVVVDGIGGTEILKGEPTVEQIEAAIAAVG